MKVTKAHQTVELEAGGIVVLGWTQIRGSGTGKQGGMLARAGGGRMRRSSIKALDLEPTAVPLGWGHASALGTAERVYMFLDGAGRGCI